jgi:hypothetical protein
MLSRPLRLALIQFQTNAMLAQEGEGGERRRKKWRGEVVCGLEERATAGEVAGNEGRTETRSTLDLYRSMRGATTHRPPHTAQQTSPKPAILFVPLAAGRVTSA